MKVIVDVCYFGETGQNPTFAAEMAEHGLTYELSPIPTLATREVGPGGDCTVTGPAEHLTRWLEEAGYGDGEYIVVEE